MSTPICDTLRRAALVAACLALAACDAAGLPGLGAGLSPAPSQVAVTADRIVVTGPRGFCVDPTATRDTAETGFVVLGNCAAIANSRRAAQPATPAVLTATISERAGDTRLADNLDQLDAFFRSDEGKTLLSRSRNPNRVRILETDRTRNVFFLHATDRSTGAIADVQPTYWRAYLDVGPRLATLSVLALQDRSLTREESLSLLRSFVQTVQDANSAQ
jgi:hypothetical protein